MVVPGHIYVDAVVAGIADRPHPLAPQATRECGSRTGNCKAQSSAVRQSGCGPLQNEHAGFIRAAFAMLLLKNDSCCPCRLAAARSSPERLVSTNDAAVSYPVPDGARTWVGAAPGGYGEALLVTGGNRKRLVSWQVPAGGDLLVDKLVGAPFCTPDPQINQITYALRCVGAQPV